MNPRLPEQVVPKHYAIELAPDLDTATFSGSVTIDIDIVEATDTIVCNAAELDINGALLEAGGASRGLDAALDSEAQRLTLAPVEGSRPFAPGPARLRIRFSGVLNDQLRGFYRSTYTDDSDRTQVIATTQFQSTDARRAFPCWDEPALKATFEVTLVVAQDLLAVSNTAQTSRESLADGRERVRFAPTMPMSTYLVAFVVGNLEATEAVDCDGVPVRVVHRPGRGSQTGFALDVAAHALGWFSNYYGLPYPSDKLDLIAVPDFAFGAMENLGCVTFREVLLLVEPDTASQPELQRVADVINHELAHMWFGDLVTMAWWEGIWLNEAFATFMETACSDAYRPDWQVWSTFCRGRAAALSTDALSATRAVEYPVITPAEAEDMFDVITYEKGAALVRMLEQYLGSEDFRAGVRLYLRRHAHSNTVTSDLWDALGDASGQPVREMMEAWIHQGGYPQMTVRAGEHHLEIAQRHFTLDPSRSDDRLWAVPLRLRMRSPGGAEHELKVLLDGPRQTIATGPSELVTLNSGASGFYRSVLDIGVLDEVRARGLSQLTGAERHGLVDDAWAFTLAGCLEAEAFLSFVLDCFTSERDLIVWQAIAGPLGHLRRLLEGEAAERFGSLVVAASEAAALTVGLEPQRRGEEDDRTRELRATLLTLRGATAGDRDTIDACRARLDHPDPTLAAAALTVSAVHGDAEHFARVRRRFETASDPQAEQRHLAALADFPDGELVSSILEGTLDGTVRTQDGPYLLRRAMANHRSGPAAWQFLAGHWEELVAAFPSNSLARMLEGVTALDEPQQAQAVHHFVSDHPVPQGAKQVTQHLERLDINVALRVRDAERLAAAILSY